MLKLYILLILKIMDIGIFAATFSLKQNESADSISQMNSHTLEWAQGRFAIRQGEHR